MSHFSNLSLTPLEFEALQDLEFMAFELAELTRRAQAGGTHEHYSAIRRRLTDITTTHMVLARRPLAISQANSDTDWTVNEIGQSPSDLGCA